MSITLQVIYPASEGATFDMDYYTTKHLPLAGDHFGKYASGITASKGIAGPGPDTSSPAHVIATLTFDSMDALGEAMAGADHVLGDIPNFYSGEPLVMTGEVLG